MAERRIFKYPLAFATVLPLGETDMVIHVAEQDGQVMLWADVTVRANVEDIPTRTFVILATGATVEQNLTPVGTVLMRNGLVWHVYEVA